MKIRQFTIAAIGLAMLAMGPAAALVAPAAALADDPPPTCQQTCHRTMLQSQAVCKANVPRYPTQDDSMVYYECMLTTVDVFAGCVDACPEPPPPEPPPEG